MQDGRTTQLVERLDPVEDLNYRHFRMRHMVAELFRPGVLPGTEAPDFALETTEGGRLRLSDLRGRPVLLHFVSYTCPVTRGGVTTMKELHRLYGDRVTFIEMVVRQAHPGERHGGYTSYEPKLEDGRAYTQEESIPWPVLVDDLAGTIQLAYGGLAAAVYLIDSRGVVSFCGVWGQSPALRTAIEDLLAHDGVAARAGKGTDRRLHLAAAFVDGQRGPLRGGRRSLIDLELGFPGASILMAAGRLGRPVLEPLAVRTTPVPPRTRAAVLLGFVGLGTAVAFGLHRWRSDRCT